MTIEQQFLTISFMGGSSFIIGILFDGYRVIKGRMNLPKFIVFLIDIFFGIFSALLTFYLLLWSNNGQFRIIYIIVFFIMLYIYYQTTSAIIINIWVTFFNFLISLWRIIMRIVNFVLIKPLKIIYQLILIVLTFLLTILTFVGNFFNKFFRILFGNVVIQTKKVSSKFKTRSTKKRGFLLGLKKLLKWKKE